MTSETLTCEQLTLTDLGWGPAFQSQLDIDEIGHVVPVRVAGVHRAHLDVIAEGFAGRVPGLASGPDDDDGQVAVGDWLLADATSGRLVRRLARTAVFSRKAPGTGRAMQVIAANVDTVFVVTSCNQDFNAARLERYLSVVREAEATPVIVLTKADLADDTDGFVATASRLMAGVVVECLNAHDPADVARLAPWCGPGQTVALLGSSGVGKSTLANTLMGTSRQATGGIREDDAKGRHTTTGRSMHRLPKFPGASNDDGDNRAIGGGWLIDAPGMRELQLADVASGLQDVFADVVAAADACRFNDCTHDAEPGCAVQAAIAAGEIEAGRLRRYRKLLAEDRFNSQSHAERRRHYRNFGRMVRDATASKKTRREM